MGCICFETVLNVFFYLQIRSEAKYFSSKKFWSGIFSCYNILFWNLKKKEHSIIISRVISSHMRHMYSETLYIYIYTFKKN